MHRQIKAVRIAACATFLLLSAAKCGPADPPGPCERPSHHTIVFFDQSASSQLDPATAALFRDTVAALAESALQCQGDAIHGFLVHANTRGKVNRVDVMNTVEPLGDTLAMPSIDRARAAGRHRARMDTLRADARARLTALEATSVSPQFRANTDLLGTLEVVSDEMSHADSGSTARVYYLGDMHESMPPPRRDFDTRRPADRPEAEAWADADTAVLRGMSFDREQMANVEVRVLLGALADRRGAAEVRSYWERLFANAGIRKVRYN